MPRRKSRRSRKSYGGKAYDKAEKERRRRIRSRVNNQWQKVKNSGKYRHRYGSKAQVAKGYAFQTKGNPPLTKDDIKVRCKGEGEKRVCRYVSRKRSEQALKRWKSDPKLRAKFKEKQEELKKQSKKKSKGGYYYGGRRSKRSRRKSRRSRRKSRRSRRRKSYGGNDYSYGGKRSRRSKRNRRKSRRSKRKSRKSRRSRRRY